MKRSNSRGLDELLGARLKRHAPDAAGYKRQLPPTGPKTSTHARGLVSHGLQLATSSSGAATLEHGLPEVCSPPPSKPLGFLAPELPVSPFAKAPAHSGGDLPPCPWAHGSDGADRQQQPRANGSGRNLSEEEDWDQENQQPCGASGMAEAAASTWLVSPVSRGRPPASVPHSGTAGLLSPGMPTPARNAPQPSALPPTLQHAPSFSSWMVSAGRPPSPQPQPQFIGAGVVGMSEVVAGILTDVTAACRFDSGRPSQLDFLLAKLGDTHYPASVMQWEQEELPDSPADCS